MNEEFKTKDITFLSYFCPNLYNLSAISIFMALYLYLDFWGKLFSILWVIPLYFLATIMVLSVDYIIPKNHRKKILLGVIFKVLIIIMIISTMLTVYNCRILYPPNDTTEYYDTFNGKIIGKLNKEDKIFCIELDKKSCMFEINGKIAYILLNDINI